MSTSTSRQVTYQSLRTIHSDEMQNHKLIQSNIEGTKRATTKEMEQNEKLESFKLRLDNDFDLLEQKRELA